MRKLWRCALAASLLCSPAAAASQEAPRLGLLEIGIVRAAAQDKELAGVVLGRVSDGLERVGGVSVELEQRRSILKENEALTQHELDQTIARIKQIRRGLS